MSYPWFELQRENINPEYRNFNGGLSLRKKIDMLKIINTYPPQKTVNNSTNLLTDAEDVYFVIGSYKLGLSVGDDEESCHFAVHTVYKSNWFGIHNSILDIKNKLSIDYPEIKDIIQRATSQSLILLDEIGRGTEFYDGFSLAISISQYFIDKVKAIVFFSSHYHELPKFLPKSIKKYQSSAFINSEGKISFSYKIIPGVATSSYGIEVAELAGLPSAIIQQAYQQKKKELKKK